ncbi:MAG: biotin/lipoyl-binding protein [Burkholderiales bacterium]|jgi:pyruvate/2-oxoglutarate dehydrogenase complex dihydrolipoamide acyltransferase (E2) component|nr:biotin/lipoyl-binding protein [Burkholderiales bacterium]
MTEMKEIRIPKAPACWESCGNCADGELLISSVEVAVGDTLALDDTLIVVETNKTSLDIPSPYAGTVVEVLVKPGNIVKEGDVIVRIEQPVAVRCAHHDL